MGNICEFGDQQVLDSFDQYDRLKKSQYEQKEKNQQCETANSQVSKGIPLLHIQNHNCCETAHTQKSIQHKIPQKNQEIQRVHRISITPPSQRDIALFKKLQQQSQVPSEFFQNVDLSLYFNTFKTLKENFDHYHPLNNKLSTNRTNKPFTPLSTNSLSQFIGDQRNQLKDHVFHKRKPSEKLITQKQNLTIQELKKTKMYMTQLQIKNK